jgi:hypothetical protein
MEGRRGGTRWWWSRSGWGWLSGWSEDREWSVHGWDGGESGRGLGLWVDQRDFLKLEGTLKIQTLHEVI